MDFLNVTKASIEEARSSGFPEFGDNEKVTFLVEEIKEDSANSLVTVGCKVLTGENEGKRYNHFLRDNQASVKIFINMMAAYFTDGEIAGRTKKITDLIGKKLESVAKKSKPTPSGKIYTNFYDFEAVSDVPAGLAQAEAIGPEAVASEGTATGDDDLL